MGGEEHNAAVWLVDRHVDEGRGDRVAVVCGEQCLTYADLQAELWKVGHALADLGVEGGQRVAIVANDEPGHVAWFLGSMRAAVVPVVLNTMLLGPEAGAIVADSGAVVLVVSEGHAAKVTGIVAAAPDVRVVVVLGDPTGAAAPDGVMVRSMSEWDGRGGDPVPAAGTTVDSDGVWLYSSGTTGVPKGVMHAHGDLRATFETYATTVLGIGPDDRCFSIAKLFFAYGLGNSLTFPLAAGATAVLDPRPPTPATVAEVVARERPTLFFASPGFAAALLDAGVEREVFSSVRLGVTAGEALPGEMHRRFTEHFGFPVLDGIGTTEALHIFMSNTAGAERPGTSGTVVEGYEARLVDAEGADMHDADTPGFLLVRGDSLASGYWNRPEQTAETFRDGWLRTGDVYTRSADGYWTFLGRNNDMMKVGGIWVSPAEVEAVIVEHPDVLEAAVVGAHDQDGLETAVAFVVARAGHAIDEASIVDHCRQRMAPFKRPRSVVVVDELPKTATGKIRRFALRESLTA